MEMCGEQYRMNEIKAERKEDFIELLRIVCMLWIILHHICGSISMDYLLGKTISFNYFFDLFCFIGGDISNNIFFLIMGYNLAHKSFKKERIVRIWYKCLFYSVLSWTIVFFMDHETCTFKNVIFMLFPILANTWWFASTYIVILLISQGLNLLIDHCDRMAICKYIVKLMIPFAVLSNVCRWLSDANSIYIAVIMYMIGGLIRKYSAKIEIRKCIFGGGYFDSMLFEFCTCVGSS